MDYRVYFADGNQRIFYSQNGMIDVLEYLFNEGQYSQTEIWKIEEI